MPALKKNSSLMVLNLGNNLLNGEISGKKISNLISNCKNLLELDISDNLIKSKGSAHNITALCLVNKDQ